MCVGFLYTLVSSLPSGSLVTRAERTHSEGEKIKSFEVVIALVLRKMTL